MIYVNYPNIKTERLTFYLATEEYLAKNFPSEEYFFMWQVEPTVIFGRNQLIENEVNLDYVKRENISFYRRKSGGGCVYSDQSNIMFSFITPFFNKDFVFDKYLTKVVDLLKDLGLNAVFSGRNDILIEDKKVSGNAFYRANNRSIVHGTMLYNTDISVMVKAITPDNEKLISKGIDSVRSRVTNIIEHLDISIEDFKDHFKNNLCDSHIILTDDEVLGIREIEKAYLLPEFIYGKNPNYSLKKKAKTNAGIIEVSVELKNNVVVNMNMLGDYFLIEDLSDFLALFKKQEFTRTSFNEILEKHKIEEYIYNLTKKQFLDILF